MPENTTAELRVAVTTALGAVAVPGAVVRVSSVENGERTLLHSVFTGQDGMSPPMILSAPPSYLSMSPGVGAPYSVYTVEVAAEGFTPIAALTVTMFGGIAAVLPVALTPLPENAVRGDTKFTSIGDTQSLTQPMLPERGGNNIA